MKIKGLFFSLALLISTVTFGQVGIGTTRPDQSAVLELESTTKGFNYSYEWQKHNYTKPQVAKVTTGN